MTFRHENLNYVVTALILWSFYVVSKSICDDASFGWLNTGDLGWLTPHYSVGRSRLCGGVLVIEGRLKDTIVLSTGENVEPSEIEEAAIRSSLIHQILVFGQDERRIGSIIVPDKQEVKEAKRSSIIAADSGEISKESLASLLRVELRTWTSDCTHKVGPMLIVDETSTDSIAQHIAHDVKTEGDFIYMDELHMPLVIGEGSIHIAPEDTREDDETVLDELPLPSAPE